MQRLGNALVTGRVLEKNRPVRRNAAAQLEPRGTIACQLLRNCGPGPLHAFNPDRIDMMSPWHLIPRLAIINFAGGLFVAMLALAGNPAIAAEPPIRSLEVTFDGEVYVVNAVFFALAPQSVAWDVLTDFDRLAKWVPNVTESKVLKRDDTGVTVEQRGVARYGAASFPYVTERKIALKPPTNIKTAQIKGNMRRVESTINLETDGKGTKILYRLEIVPSIFAGAVMSKKFVEHEITEQFTAIVGEMNRRGQ